METYCIEVEVFNLLSTSLAKAIRLARNPRRGVSLRRVLMVSLLVGATVSCDSDDNDFTIDPLPPMQTSISAPTNTEFSTLADGFQINATVSAESSDELVTRVQVEGFVVALDADGAQIFDASGVAANQSPLMLDSGTFPTPLGQQEAPFYQQQVSPLVPGFNILTVTPSSVANPDDLPISTSLMVTHGESWMRETAIQYDENGDLYALDQVAATVIRIDIDAEGVAVKTPLTLSGATLDRPMDMEIVGTTAYILDEGTSGIYEIADIGSATPSINMITDCSQAGEQFVDPAVFAVNPNASPGSSAIKFYVADRGAKEIIQISAEDTPSCSFLPTPNTLVDDPTTDEEDLVIPVPGSRLHLPNDIAFYPAGEQLFLSGSFIVFDVVESTNEQDEIELETVSTPGFSPVLAVINVNDGTREAVQTVSADGLFANDDSAPPVYGLITPGELLVSGDELFVVDQLVTFLGDASDGVLVADISPDRFPPQDPENADTDLANAFAFRPVSGSYGGTNLPLNSDGTQLPNPDLGTALQGVTAIARNGDTLATLNIGIGSYITVDLSVNDNPDCRTGFDEEPGDNPVIQCEFVAARTLIRGGGAIFSTTQQEDSETDVDNDYVVSARANSRFNPATLKSVTNSPQGFLAFDRVRGELEIGLTPQITDFDDTVDNSSLIFGDAVALSSGVTGSDVFFIEPQTDSFFAYSILDNRRSLLAEESEDESEDSVTFVDPIASAVIRPTLFNTMSNQIETLLTRAYVIDRSQSSSLVQVMLEDEQVDEEVDEDDMPPAPSVSRGDRSLIDAVGCNFSNVEAIASLQISSLDINDDGLSADELESADRLTAIIMVNDANELIAVRFPNDANESMVRCEQILDGISGSGNYPSLVVGNISTQTSVSDSGDSDVEENGNGAVVSRNFSVMVLDKGNNGSSSQLIEMNCSEDVEGDGLISCLEVAVFEVSPNADENKPVSPAALSFIWDAAFPIRQAVIYDDRVNSVFVVDLSYRIPPEGGPCVSCDTPEQIVESGAVATAQTLISVQGSPFNCDPENDLAACRNL